MARVKGWEQRLQQRLEAGRGVAYQLGVADCLTMACACVEAITGRDYRPQFGHYSTRREAYLQIRRFGRTLVEAVDKVLGIPHGPPLMAQRGDLLVFRDDVKELHLGVCIGETVQLTLEHGAGQVKITDPRLVCSWRIE